MKKFIMLCLFDKGQKKLQNIQNILTKMLARILVILTLTSIVSSGMVWLADIANPGARYPVNDLYDGKDNPTLQGQLNTVGMRQQYLLGTYLRADYIDRQQLISHKFNPNTVEVFACGGVDRALLSALCRLYGVFPIGTGWRIPQQVPASRLQPAFQSNYSYRGFTRAQQPEPFALQDGFQPVPVWPLDEYLNDACPNSGVIKTKRLQQISKTLTAFQAQHSALLSKIKLVFNLSSLQMNIPTMADLYDTLLSDLTLGKELPKQFDEYDMKSLKYISDYYNTLLNDGSYARTFGTLILQVLKIKMQLARTRKLADKKWTMFFTKQGTITPLMTILNLTSVGCLTQRWKNQTVTDLNCMQPPTFSSNLLLELHQDDAFEYFVKIKYNGQYVNMCQKNKTKCEYHDFWGRIYVNRTEYNQTCYGK